MTDRLPINASLAEVYAWYCSLFPPPQCAPALGVHQGCDHAEQSRPSAHFTIDAGGTCTRNSRVTGRCEGGACDCCARGEQSPRRAELAGSTVAPPVDASNPYAGRSLAELEAVMQSEEYRRPRAVQPPATGVHVTRGC